MKKKITLLTCILVSSYGFSQVGINTENPQSTLHVTPTKTDGSTAEGIIAPNLTRAQLISKDSKYTSALQGSIVYVTAINGTVSTKTANVTSVGYYYFDGQLWQAFKGDVASQPWNKVGTTSASTTNTDNSYLNAQVVVGGTTPASINGGTNNARLTVSGGDASINGLTAGRGAGNLNGNTVVGLNSLAANTTGNYNTAVGVSSLKINTTGASNVALGNTSMLSNTTGNYNTAVGISSLRLNTTGSNNVSIGSSSLQEATDVSNMVAIGGNALFNIITGESNVAVGSAAGEKLTSGNDNTFVGRVAGNNQTSGSFNIAIGSQANLPSLIGSNQMNIGNAIYGTTSTTGAAGSVSIGKTAPATGVKLDVSGKTQLNDFRYVNGTQGAGKILTSDASGNATWVAVNSTQNPIYANAYGGTSTGVLTQGMDTGIKITLPANSSWLVFLGQIFSFASSNYLKNGSEPDWIWVRLLWSDTPRGETSDDVKQGKLISASITPGPSWAFATGVSFIKNTSSQPKTYYLTTGKIDSHRADGSPIEFLTPFGERWSENYLYAIPTNN